MRIKDKPGFDEKPKPITFTPNNTVQEALDRMCEKNIGSIIILADDDTIAGIVTERDMMIRVLGAGVDPKTTPLSQIMTKNVQVAHENDELVDWIRTMSNERFRHLPIVNDQGQLVGLMSQGDLLAYTWPDIYESVKLNMKGRMSKPLQLLIVVFALMTLSLVALNM